MRYITTYELDSKGKIIRVSEEGTDEYNIVWDADIRVEVNLPHDETWGETVQYNEYNHPMSAINLAILNTHELDYIGTEFDNVYQNKYCISMFQEWDFGADEIEYQYNEEGYPTRATVIPDNDYIYFEYELD